jgi:hypothetical protein
MKTVSPLAAMPTAVLREHGLPKAQVPTPAGAA